MGTDNTSDEAAVADPVSRRGMLGTIGKAAIAGATAVVGASALTPDRAESANGLPVLLGRHNDASKATWISLPAGAESQVGFICTHDAADDGAAIRGSAHGRDAAGVTGEANAPDGRTGDLGWTKRGVSGIRGRSGSGVGVDGVSPRDSGVRGQSRSGAGVEGISESWIGVAGRSKGSTGVHGESETGFGVFGLAANSVGVAGRSVSAQGVDGRSSSFVGVLGHSQSSSGVHGESEAGFGVLGLSKNNVGVAGNSVTAQGVDGRSTSFVGVMGHSQSSSGVHGESVSGFGVLGLSTSSTGVAGASTSGTAVDGASQSGIGVFGRSDSTIGTAGLSKTGAGVAGTSGNAVTGVPIAAGVLGQSDIGPGLAARSSALARPAVEAEHTNGAGFQSLTSLRGAVLGGTVASVRLVPSIFDGHPHDGLLGDLSLDASGALWLCKGGTNWVQIA